MFFRRVGRSYGIKVQSPKIWNYFDILFLQYWWYREIGHNTVYDFEHFKPENELNLPTFERRYRTTVVLIR